MSECYRVALTYADGAAGPGIGRAQGRRQRSGEQADGSGARSLRTRGAVLHRRRASHRRSRRALLQLGVRRRNRRLPPAARGCRACRRRRRDPRRHNRTGDAGDDRAGPAARAAARRRRAGRCGVAQPRIADEPGAHRGAVCRVSSNATATHIDPAHREVCERLVASFDAYLAQEAARTAFTGWCTATTGWTTCCSGSRAPTGRSPSSTGRPSPGGRR